MERRIDNVMKHSIIRKASNTQTGIPIPLRNKKNSILSNNSTSIINKWQKQICKT